MWPIQSLKGLFTIYWHKLILLFLFQLRRYCLTSIHDRYPLLNPFVGRFEPFCPNVTEDAKYFENTKASHFKTWFMKHQVYFMHSESVMEPNTIWPNLTGERSLRVLPTCLNRLWGKGHLANKLLLKLILCNFKCA